MIEPKTLWDVFAEERDGDRAGLPYNGHSGFVAGSDTSKARALDEDDSGVTSQRMADVMETLRLRPQGMIWAEVGKTLGLHHGQVSGSLSMLHKIGQIFMLKAKRDNCHIYVHLGYKENYGASERIDEPAQTRSGAEKDARKVLLAAVDLLLEATTFDTVQGLRDAREHYKHQTEKGSK